MNKIISAFTKYCHILLALFLVGFSFLLPIIDKSIAFQNHTYSFLRELSQQQYPWVLNTIHYNNIESNCNNIREELRNINTSRGFYRSTINDHLSFVDDNGDFIKHNLVFKNELLSNATSIVLSTYCDGNTSKEGVLYVAPLRVMFFNNTNCDVTYYKGADSVASIYIPDIVANLILEKNEELKEYKDLLGQTIYVDGRPNSICNIFYSSDILAPLLLSYYGCFFVSTDYSFLDSYKVSATFCVEADTITFMDYFNYLSYNDTESVRFTYKDNNGFVYNEVTDYFSNISNNSMISPKIYIVLPYFCVIIFFAFVCFRKMKDSLFKKHNIVFVLLCFSILIVINICNLFVYGNIALLNLFNGYCSLTCFTVIVTWLVTLIIYLYNKKVFYKVNDNGCYELDI